MKKILFNLLLSVLVAALVAVTVLNAMSVPTLFSSEGTDKGASTASTIGPDASHSYLLPEFIGAKGPLTGSIGLLANKTSVTEVYTFLAPFIASAFANGTGRYDEAYSWSELIREENTVYLRYHSELKAAMIGAHIDGSYTLKGENPDVFEMLFVLHDDGINRTAYTVYTRSRYGKICCFTSAKNVYVQNGNNVYFDAEAFSRFSDLSGSSEFDYLALQSISGIPQSALMLESQHILAAPPSPSGL
ncbi:MAG: hypothetical protein IIV03_01850, partial [Clostridia bacterium]|nr:hypothetical protein [Clostridia bacterium]